MDTGDGVSRASSIRSRPNFTPIGPRTPSFRQDLRSSLISPNFSPSSSPFSTVFPPSSEARTLPTLREDLQEVQTPVFQGSDAHPPAYSTLQEPTVPEPARSPATPPRIPPPPKVKFESEQVEWKALPLEAALWTFSSTELQQIVSRAIRSSASESFIRLLSIENVDQVLPAELQRLEQLKFSMQSKYRFLVHRRTMVLQALIANVQISSFKDKEKEDIMDSVTKLAMQLSDTTAECDRILEELLKISDRTTQINRMLDTHCASALAIAIRKLNNSYSRRTTDLRQARERITQLEAELEDAWNEAEKLAKEMDDYEAELGQSDEAVIGTAEIVPVPLTPTTPRPQSGMLLNVEPIPRSPLTPRYTKPMADIPADINGQEDNQDSASIRSVRSTRSAKSTRSTVSARGEVTRSMTVSAARTRSSRTSHGSLRLPSLHSRKQSNSRPKTPADVQPPVPDLPLRFTSQPFDSSAAANASSVLLHGESPGPSPRVSLRTFTDESSRSDAPPLSRTRANLDDIVLDDNMIEEVPRTPKWKNASLDDIRLICKSHSRGSAGISPVGHSPSIWRNVDTPKTPAERVESLMRHNSKATPYQKIKTLTKRYSLPFPLLGSAKSVATRRSSNRSRTVTDRSI